MGTWLNLGNVNRVKADDTRALCLEVMGAILSPGTSKQYGGGPRACNCLRDASQTEDNKVATSTCQTYKEWRYNIWYSTLYIHTSLPPHARSTVSSGTLFSEPMGTTWGNWGSN